MVGARIGDMEQAFDRDSPLLNEIRMLQPFQIKNVVCAITYIDKVECAAQRFLTMTEKIREILNKHDALGQRSISFVPVDALRGTNCHFKDMTT